MKGRRLLFFLGYPGYLRYFDRTIVELADRGYEVLLVFDSAVKQAEGLAAFDGIGDSVRVVGQTPRRSDHFAPLARGLRLRLDYLRYLHPRFRDAEYLRTRQREATEKKDSLGVWARLPLLPGRIVDLLAAMLRVTERAIPASREARALLSEHEPDAVIVTPLVTKGSPQTDVVKAAHRLGIPVALAVASWDHLTTKGMIRADPDRVMVWNEVQAREARELHRIPAGRIGLTGAQPFDRWFARKPSTTREEFCAKVGLPAERPFVLFVGSTASISHPDQEQRFVRAWIEAIRGCGEPSLREVGILIRPHPYNPGTWAHADLSGLEHVAVWPRHDANPVDEGDRADYFDSMHHSAAVVGINTSAMIESAIVGRPVHTIRAGDFDDTQMGTLHFHYLLPENGGFLKVADSLDEHTVQLAASLADPDRTAAELSRFVASFVRPNGLDRPCVPILADQIEQVVNAGSVRPRDVPARLLPLTGVLAVAGVRHRYARRGRLGKDIVRASNAAQQSLDAAADRIEAAGLSGDRLRRAGRSLQQTGRQVNARLRERAPK
jgi:hypothetical protein